MVLTTIKMSCHHLPFVVGPIQMPEHITSPQLVGGPADDLEGLRANNPDFSWQMNTILSQAAANMYAQQRLFELKEKIEEIAAASVIMQPSHRRTLAPAPPQADSHRTEALLAACLSAMPAHKSWPNSMGNISPQAPTWHSPPPSTFLATLPRLPALTALLACAEGPPIQATAANTPDVAVRARKKYRTRFSLDEEEALINFWFKFRFKYSVKSKILWRMAERSGVTDRDAISVQKHFDHILKYGRMRDLFRTFRRKGRLTDAIDSIDVDKDFNVLPLHGDARTSASFSESESEEGDGHNA